VCIRRVDTLRGVGHTLSQALVTRILSRKLICQSPCQRYNFPQLIAYCIGEKCSSTLSASRGSFMQRLSSIQPVFV